MNNLETYHGYILLTCDGSDINTILLILKHSISQRMEAEAIIIVMETYLVNIRITNGFYIRQMEKLNI